MYDKCYIHHALVNSIVREFFFFALPFLQDKKKIITEVYIMNRKYLQRCQQFQQYQPNEQSTLTSNH